MIRVMLPPEPPHYHKRVKNPGEAFLSTNPNPSGTEWDRHRYWREIHDDLYQWHGGICVYCASWTPRRQSPGNIHHTSVDHFIPKSEDPNSAYEWTNFRLCRARLNNKKDNHLDVMDPRAIRNGWFSLDFFTFRVEPATGLPSFAIAAVRTTITRLELNDDQDYVEERIAVIQAYSLDLLPFSQVQARYPFIAQQMQYQEFDTRFKPRWRAFFKGVTTTY